MARKPAKGKASAQRKAAFEALSVALGDRIRVERRFVVDGTMKCVADKGVFHGVQQMGSIEHLLLERKGEVHLIPIPSISEIVLEGVEEKRGASSAAPAQGFDPSFA